MCEKFSIIKQLKIATALQFEQFAEEEEEACDQKQYGFNCCWCFDPEQ